MNKHYNTLIAIGLFAVFVFCGSLTYGLTVFFAALITVVATVMVGGLFLVLHQKTELLDSITGITLLTIGMVFVSILFFAGDCLVGYISVPTAPLFEGCVKHSGMGFILTAAVTILFGGVIIVALVRATIVNLYGNG